MAIKWNTPHAILGIAPNAGAKAARAAYLDLIRAHPPDRSPRRFAEISQAYEEFIKPEERINRLLFETDMDHAISELINQIDSTPNHTGPIPWIEALK